MPHHTLRTIAFVLPFTVGCAAVIGADYSEATPLPAGASVDPSCNPVIGIVSAEDAKLFVNCAVGEQCSLESGVGKCQKGGDASELDECKKDSDCKSGHRCDLNFCRKNCYSVAECADLPTRKPECIARPTSNAKGMVGVCASFCDPVTNDTCFDGEQCAILAQNVTECRTIGGDRKPGQKCVNSPQCGRGICVGSQTLGYRCEKYCHLDSNECGEGVRCTELKAGIVNGKVFGFCDTPRPPCDLVNPTNSTPPYAVCGNGNRCTLGSTGESTCTPPGAKKESESCQTGDECSAGLVCFCPPGATCTETLGKRCLRPCRVGTCNDSSPNQDCQSRACACSEAKPSVAGVQYGFCVGSVQ